MSELSVLTTNLYFNKTGTNYMYINSGNNNALEISEINSSTIYLNFDSLNKIVSVPNDVIFTVENLVANNFTGLTGPTGLQGYQGIQGLQGYQGLQGLQGPQGVIGNQGLQGIVGEKGQGFVIFATTSSYTGLTNINCSTNNIGEFVLITGGDLFVYMGTGLGTTGLPNPPSYDFVGDITDETKIIGPQGLQGLEGYQGLQGYQGLAGLQGVEGVQGLQGYQGLQGLQGLQGYQGLQGIEGLQGLVGAQGLQGTQGTTLAPVAYLTIPLVSYNSTAGATFTKNGNWSLNINLDSDIVLYSDTTSGNYVQWNLGVLDEASYGVQFILNGTNDRGIVKVQISTDNGSNFTDISSYDTYINYMGSVPYIYQSLIFNVPNNSTGVVIRFYSNTKNAISLGYGISLSGNISIYRYSAASAPRGFQGFQGDKTFVIDHPIHQDKYLVHACLEGPEVGVYYRGRAEIKDGEDSVEISLPEYAKLIANNFTVHLTAVNSYNHLYTSEVENGVFKVYGKGKFFWSVYGERRKIETEPLKIEVELKGNGPYKWI